MNQLNLATKAAWLAYVGGYTQSEIAKRLNVSSVKAHRLIAYAHDNNIVKIFVEGEIVECVQLEEKLLKQFNLNSCVVAPEVEGTDGFTATGTAGASFLYDFLKKNKDLTIGIGKGRSITAVVEKLPHFQVDSIQFVSVSGGLTRKFSTNPYDVIHSLAERTGAEAYFLPVPYMAKDQNEMEMLLQQQSIQQMLNHAKQADLYLVGIGSVESNAHVHENGLIEEKTWNEMIESGAVGDFMGRFMDAEGNDIDDTSNHLSLGLSANDIKGKKVVSVVGGAKKGRALLAALRKKVITDLIVSEETAKELVELI